jgi:two-component system OmpR family sensor kinase
MRWLLVLAPTLIGLAVGLWLNWSAVSNPVFYLQSDLGSLIFGLGLLISLLVGVVFVVLDWVERNRLEAIVGSAEDRRRFLRRLDHELKNPLTAILAGLANLSMSAGGQEQGAALESVRTQVQRLSRLAAELRKLSELEVRPLERTPVDMSLLLEEAFALAQDGGAAEDLALTLSIPRAPWPLPKVNGDRDLLVLALHNLLSNAVKFSRPGDTVEVRAFEDGSSVVVEVADTGSGIPEDEIAHVWEELYRGEGARGVPGSGLGLALVRAIVARHDGQVNLRSRPGEGTVFTMRLPIGGSGG